MPRGRRKKSENQTLTADDIMEDAAGGSPISQSSAELSSYYPSKPGNNINEAEKPAEEQPEAIPTTEPMETSTADEAKNEEENMDDIAPDAEQFDVEKVKEELTNLDVLVCGRCHNVFHFTEDLNLHKKNDCSGVSVVLNGNFKPDSKVPVWAFVLYKTFQMKQNNSEWKCTPWQMYRKWSELKENVKTTWMEAGRDLQQIAAFLPKAIGNPKRIVMGSDREKTLKDLQKELEDDNETEMMTSLGLQRERAKDAKGTREINQIWRKPLVKKDGDDEDEVLYTAEKIVAKRANPKTKQAEYLVKWLGYPSDVNTWEQVRNMDSCMKLVQEFERNLAKQKARKAMEAKEKSMMSLNDSTPLTPGGRPVRHSALKALDQVKEWVGGKRGYEDDNDDDDDDKKMEFDVSRKKFQKNPVIVANAKGMHRVDARSVPNLSSGVYIISTQTGLIKVDESTATKLSNCLNSDDRKKVQGDSKITMINETEVRKISASQVTPKIGILRKDTPVSMKKDSPNVSILQRGRTPLVRAPPTRSPLHRQIILGGQKTRPSPGPIVNTTRTPIAKPRVSIKPASTPRQRQVGAIIRAVTPATHTAQRKEKPKIQEEELISLTEEEYQKSDDAGSPLTLCPMTGEIIGQSDEKTAAVEDNSMPDVDDDGMMHVAVSPGGSYHQVAPPVRKTDKNKAARSLLAQRRTIEEQQQQQQEQEQPAAEQELISIEGEDGVIYHITPEQQQMLIQNGTITMDSCQDENREVVIENGQILERRMSDGGGEHTVLLNTETGEPVKDENVEGEIYGEDGMLTLDSAVQEAVAQPNAEQADGKQNEQLVAQIIHAEPPTPGVGTRKVVLLLPDGQMIQTDMDEAQYQSLEFEK